MATENSCCHTRKSKDRQFVYIVTCQSGTSVMLYSNDSGPVTHETAKKMSGVPHRLIVEKTFNMSICTLLVSGQCVLGHPMYIWSTTVLHDMNNHLIGTQVSTLILHSRSNQTGLKCFQ